MVDLVHLQGIHNIPHIRITSGVTRSLLYAVIGHNGDSRQCRQKITIPASNVNANLTDYPVYVDLADLQPGIFAHAKLDGSDIRITTSDGVTEVPHELVDYSAGDRCYVSQRTIDDAEEASRF